MVFLKCLMLINAEILDFSVANNIQLQSLQAYQIYYIIL